MNHSNKKESRLMQQLKEWKEETRIQKKPKRIKLIAMNAYVRALSMTYLAATVSSLLYLSSFSVDENFAQTLLASVVFVGVVLAVLVLVSSD